MSSAFDSVFEFFGGGLRFFFWLLGAAAVVAGLIAFGIVLGDSGVDSAATTLSSADPNQESEDDQVEELPPAAVTTAAADPTTTEEVSQDQDSPAEDPPAIPAVVPGILTVGEFRALCGGLRPTTSPPRGDVDIGDLDCPVLSSTQNVPFQVDEWIVPLAEGQEISFVFDHNIADRHPGFEVSVVDGPVVLEMPDTGDTVGRFTAEVSGDYLLRFETDDDTRRTYTLALLTIS